MSLTSTLELTQALIAKPSLTPDDAGCIKLISEYLKNLKFKVEIFQDGEVTNLWARKGINNPLFAFVGHIDVVPPGPLTEWASPPFAPTVRNGYLFGRGAADMKSGVAAMLTAYARLLQNHPEPTGSLGFLITSDEEGPAINGTTKIVERLTQRGEKIEWCVVGEPSSIEQVGDMIKNGRRGSLSLKLIVHGIQGHIAYPHLADNPIHRITPAIAELIATQWDQGDQFFQPTSFQISNINSGTGATNVTPGILELQANFRFSPEVTASILQERVEKILNKYELKFTAQWTEGAKPFLTPAGELLNKCSETIEVITGMKPKITTDGGTSDGRFIAPTGAQVIELGVCNATIHQINEGVKVSDVDKLSMIYEKLLEKLLT